MVIKSIAQLDELSSPYYKINKDFCEEFEKFIASKRGLIKGSYNVWSYNITAKIPHKHNWIIKCNKGTYSSSGNLFLSSKKQALRVTCTWIANNLISDSSDFKIQRKNLFHLFSSRWISLSENGSYSIKMHPPNSKLLNSVIVALNHLIDLEIIMMIEYSKNKLKIQLHTDEIHQNAINNLLKL